MVKIDSSPTPLQISKNRLQLQSDYDKICHTPAAVRLRLQSMLISAFDHVTDCQFGLQCFYAIKTLYKHSQENTKF